MKKEKVLNNDKVENIHVGAIGKPQGLVFYDQEDHDRAYIVSMTDGKLNIEEI